MGPEEEKEREKEKQERRHIVKIEQGHHYPNQSSSYELYRLCYK